jgi:hypothetical protein
MSFGGALSTGGVCGRRTDSLIHAQDMPIPLLAPSSFASSTLGVDRSRNIIIS